MTFSVRRNLLAAVVACAALLAAPSPLLGRAEARSLAPTLRVFINGSGSVRGSGIDCGPKGNICGASFTLGTSITITAEAEQFSVFAGWSGACTGILPACTLTAGDPATVTATFSYIEVVDVNKQGGGDGTVTSSPEGIDCGSTCSVPFTSNTGVTLVARPAPGSVFVGWGGACRGRSACVLQQTYGSLAVIAQFEQKGSNSSYTPPTSSGGGTNTGGGSTTGGGTSHTQPHAKTYAVVNLGASAQRARTGRVISVRLSVTKPAALRVQISRGKQLISQATLQIPSGPVTIRLPFSEGYPPGAYDLWGLVKAPGESPRTIHWAVTVPR